MAERLRAVRAERPLSLHAVGGSILALAEMTAMLALATVAVGWLEQAPALVADASPVYLVAVVLIAIRRGTLAAIATATAAFLLYDYLFTEPRLTIVVADPREWLELVLFFFVALVIGRLAARETARARDATRRAREAESLATITRLLASTATVRHAAPALLRSIARDAGFERAWLDVREGTSVQVVADTHEKGAGREAATVWTLTRDRPDAAGRWVAIHAGRPGVRSTVPADLSLWTVRLEAAGSWLGSLWATRRRALGSPSVEETRIVVLAADQLALALRRERLDREATEAEIARRGEALKTALLDAVSHDLRTPLASIRATAGSLLDPDVGWSEVERLGAAQSIDDEAERLSQLVGKVHDLSRIEGGAVHPELEVFELRELVEAVVARRASGSRVVVEIGEVPPISVDPVLFTTVLSNLLDNAFRYAGPGVPIRVRAGAGDGAVDVVVEDGGRGVSERSLARLFDRFYRVPGERDGARPGLGIGLSIVRGFVEAMGGTVVGERSELGGLAVRISLPVAGDAPQA